MSVIPFKPRYIRPCGILSSPGRLRTGERYWTLDFLPSEHEGGGQIGMWDGIDYEEAVNAALDLQAGGFRVHYLEGEVRI